MLPSSIFFNNIKRIIFSPLRGCKTAMRYKGGCSISRPRTYIPYFFSSSSACIKIPYLTSLQYWSQKRWHHRLVSRHHHCNEHHNDRYYPCHTCKLDLSRTKLVFNCQGKCFCGTVQSSSSVSNLTNVSPSSKPSSIAILAPRSILRSPKSYHRSFTHRASPI